MKMEMVIAVLVRMSVVGVVGVAVVVNGGGQSYEEACKQSTVYSEFCIQSLSLSKLKEVDVREGSSGRIVLTNYAMDTALNALHLHLSNLHHLQQKQEAIGDCIELVEDAAQLIQKSIDYRSTNSTKLSSLVITLMSAALTFHTTCLDGIHGHSHHRDQGREVQMSLSNALAFLSSSTPSSSRVPTKHLSSIIRSSSAEADAVVAQDGTGNFSKISDAIASAPRNSKKRYIIYIKSGIYAETLEVPKSKVNVMFIGDGIGNTIITGHKSTKDGITTFRTATLAIRGNEFLGRDLTIRNTAGAEKHQAVAVRVSADKVAFYRCSFEGHQDTLYSHSHRQFYRECVVYGTVDSIFGNAAAVFQKCTLVARQPLKGQKNTFTAQGRTDPNQNTGFTFQDCTLKGADDLDQIATLVYLGRPWKKYSRTVYLRCYEGSLINSAGWLQWDNEFALTTLYYAEYHCSGPGSKNDKRVIWSNQIKKASEAMRFTSNSIITGNEWLHATSFPYKLGL